MNETFWNLFGDDWHANCLKWTRSGENPVIPASGETWKKLWTANADSVEFEGRTFLYYRGHGTMPGADDATHDRIGAAEVLGVTRDGIELRELNGGEPIIDVGEKGRFDDNCVLDPAAVVNAGNVLIYYSAVGSEEDSIGLSISRDGEDFHKFGIVFPGGRAPEVILKDGLIYMLFQKVIDDHYETFLAVSRNGIKFEMVQDEPVLSPGEPGSWNSFDVCTARVRESDGVYTMLYAGSPNLCDVPNYFGLARSTDMVNWEHHPGNPIFGTAAAGEPDAGAIWFPELFEGDDFFAMLYEGTHSKYHDGVTSQLCQASIEK